MTPRRTRLEVEHLGDRILPSVSALPLPAAPPAAAIHAQPPTPHALHGQGHGTYTANRIISGAGPQYHLQGSADLAGLGHVTVSGSVNGVGFIRDGHAGGTLTFTNAHGSVTVQLQGPEQPAFAALPPQFEYHVIAATGAYRGLTGQGELRLAFHSSTPPAPIAADPHGTFTLAIT